MPSNSMMSWSTYFRKYSPHNTKEVQLDEKWSFVEKKEKNCDDNNPDDARCGDNWDFVAIDAEHKLVLEVVNGKHTLENTKILVENMAERLDTTKPLLITSDEFKPYVKAILEAFGTQEQLDAALKDSKCSHHINTAFVERQNGTDRNRCSRKVRETYCFSKDWDIHRAATCLSMYSYNFCWAVRTLRRPDGQKGPCTPAMSASLTDHVWSIREWAAYPTCQ